MSFPPQSPRESRQFSPALGASGAGNRVSDKAAAYVSIGTNIERRRNLGRALTALHARFGELVTSRVYESPSVGFDGPPFFNLVAGFSTALEPPALVTCLREIEDDCGRDRALPRFSSRPMDIDLLLLGERAGSFGAVQLPRPEIADAPFVLVPLAELIPDHRHPVTGISYRHMLDQMAVSGDDIWLVDAPL